MAGLKDKIENALNESRMLMLGAQVLIGSMYRTFFDAAFDRLPPPAQFLNLASLDLMLVGLGLILSPAPYHRIAERGRTTEDLQRFVTTVLGIGLLPFALALGGVFYVVTSRISEPLAVAMGIIFSGIAITFWYVIELRHRAGKEGRLRPSAVLNPTNDGEEEEELKLSEKIKEVLIECRVVLPGAQALLGFQLISIFAEGFDPLPASSKYMHLASLAAVAISTILLMTPAAYHRIVLNGEENEEFHALAGRLLLAAMVFLGLGVSGDLLVVCRKVTGSLAASIACSLAMLGFFYGLWFGYTLWKRRQTKAHASPTQLPRSA